MRWGHPRKSAEHSLGQTLDERTEDIGEQKGERRGLL